MNNDASYKTKLPPEVLKFMSQMGLNLQGIEPEAEDIWRMLDKMSRSDPIQYQEFVQQQFLCAKDDDSAAQQRSLRPEAGFCVETRTSDGDGIKVRDVSDGTFGRLLYVNMCSSAAIEHAVDQHGLPVSVDRFSADGLSIPLVVGPPRDITSDSEDKTHISIAIDVIFHPTVIHLAEKHAHFKTQIVDLALNWVARETPLRFDHVNWKYSVQRYEGGRGEDGSTPVLFVVSDVLGNAMDAAAATSAAHPLQTPADLLHFVAGDGSSETSGAQLPGKVKLSSEVGQCAGESTGGIALPAGIRLPTRPENAAPVPRGPSLIQEINASGDAVPAFALHEVEKPQQQQQQQSKAVLASADTGPAETVTAEPPLPPTAGEYKRMERLMTAMDEDFASAQRALESKQFEDEEQSRAVLADLGRILSGGDGLSHSSGRSGSASTPVAAERAVQAPLVAADFLVRERFPEQTLAKVTAAVSSADGSLALRLEGLRSSADPALIELQVSAQRVVLRVPGTCMQLNGGAKETEAATGIVEVTVNFAAARQGQFWFDEDKSSASFSKKRKEITVSVGLRAVGY